MGLRGKLFSYEENFRIYKVEIFYSFFNHLLVGSFSCFISYVQKYFRDTIEKEKKVLKF